MGSFCFLIFGKLRSFDNHLKISRRQKKLCYIFSNLTFVGFETITKGYFILSADNKHYSKITSLSLPHQCVITVITIDSATLSKVNFLIPMSNINLFHIHGNYYLDTSYIIIGFISLLLLNYANLIMVLLHVLP